MGDVKKLAKSILDNTYDNDKEEDHLNTIIYRHLPKHERGNFKAKHLKHVTLDVLEEKAEKRKIMKEQKKVEEKVKEVEIQQ